MSYYNLYETFPIALALPDTQTLEESIIDFDWNDIEGSLNRHILNSLIYGESVLLVTTSPEEHRPSGLTLEKIRAFKRAIDDASARFVGPRYTWIPEDELEVDYAHDLDDEVPFTEALAALERIRDGVKK